MLSDSSLINLDLRFILHVLSIEMQHSLFHLLSLYGDIIEITVKRNLKMKGQAFVVFSDVDNAMKAMHDLQDHMFFEKRLVNMNFVNDFRRFNTQKQHLTLP